MDKLNQEQLSFILESAILAPSADNQHRIRLKTFDDFIQVHYAETEFPRKKSYKRVLALLSLGALSENITVAASRFNIGVDVVLLPDPAQPCLLMQINFRLNSVEVDALWQFIPVRHTNRQLYYHGPDLTSAERNDLNEAVHLSSNCQLVWLDDDVQRNSVLNLMRLAETERFRNHLLHEELFSAIRFEIGWHSPCESGLPPGALGVELPMRPIFSLLRHWPIMRYANFLGMHHILGMRACYLPCKLAPHLGMLTVTNICDQVVFDVGRSFQRFWLMLTKQDRVLQPMPASALYALDGTQSDGIPAALQSDLIKGWKENLGEGVIPIMLFRVGKAGASQVVAGRHALEKYMY